MLTTGFSVQGASLKLLRPGERGKVTRINRLPDATARSLQEMAIAPGQMITVEQRSPRFVVRIGSSRYSLNEAAMNAIYVRVVQPG